MSGVTSREQGGADGPGPTAGPTARVAYDREDKDGAEKQAKYHGQDHDSQFLAITGAVAAQRCSTATARQQVCSFG